MSQQKICAPWLWTKAAETEKGWCKGEDHERFDRISLEGQMRSSHGNMDPPPAEGNFCDDSNCPVKPHIMEWYNQHKGFIKNSDRMANSYSMSRCNFKWTTKLFFYLLDVTVLNSWILLSSCQATYTHWDFRLLLVRNLIEEAGKSQDHPTPSLVGRPRLNTSCQYWRFKTPNSRLYSRNPQGSATTCYDSLSIETAGVYWMTWWLPTKNHIQTWTTEMNSHGYEMHPIVLIKFFPFSLKSYFI